MKNYRIIKLIKIFSNKNNSVYVCEDKLKKNHTQPHNFKLKTKKKMAFKNRDYLINSIVRLSL